MLEDFREQAESTSFLDDEEAPAFIEESPVERERKFLGMTPAQRFVIALMLLLMTFILSAFCLLVTEKVIPPFLA